MVRSCSIEGSSCCCCCWQDMLHGDGGGGGDGDGDDDLYSDDS